ncbi:MAG: FAD-binding protein, partial [Opitutae bacterium]|nr:FAD-binding protein [Opitutae bacterium]
MEPIHVEILVDPDHIEDRQAIRALALAKAKLLDDGLVRVQVERRSIDARARMPRFLLRVAIGGHARQGSTFQPKALGPHRAIVVGAGPGGYFTALTLLEAGIKPIVLERGRDARARLKDIKKIYSQGLVNPHSNYCFGEGGAG